MILEGVEYFRYRVYFTLADGRRRRWVRWSPSRLFLRGEVSRELVDAYSFCGIKPGSASIRRF